MVVLGLATRSLGRGHVGVLDDWRVPDASELVSRPRGKGGVTGDCFHFNLELTGGELCRVLAPSLVACCHPEEVEDELEAEL